MDNKPKPFLSHKNPLNADQKIGESFSLYYLLPQYWFSWILISFSYILVYMPKNIRFFIGSSLGAFIWISFSKRSNIVMTNLSLCFITMSSVERKRIHDCYFQNLGKAIIDIPSLWWKSDECLQKSCDVVNLSLIHISEPTRPY